MGLIAFYSSYRSPDAIVNDSDKCNPKIYSLRTDNPSNPYEITTPQTTFEANSSAPNHYFKSVIIRNLNKYFAIYLNTSNDLDLDLSIYNDSDFLNIDPIYISNRAGYQNPEIITFYPWIESFDQHCYIKVEWKSGSGDATLWIKNSIINPVPRSNEPFIDDESFTLSNSLEVIPLNYSGGEKLNFTSELEIVGGGGSYYFNYDVYIFHGLANYSNLLDSYLGHTQTVNKIKIEVPIVSNVEADALVAIIVPHSYTHTLHFSVRTEISHSTFENYIKLIAGKTKQDNFSISNIKNYLFHSSATFNSFFAQTGDINLTWEIYLDAELTVLLYSSSLKSYQTDFCFKDDRNASHENPTGTNFYYIQITLDSGLDSFNLSINSQSTYSNASSSSIQKDLEITSSELGEIQAIYLSDSRTYDFYTILSSKLDLDVYIFEIDKVGRASSSLSLECQGNGIAEILPGFSVNNSMIYYFIMLKKEGVGTFQLNLKYFHDGQSPIVNAINFPTMPIDCKENLVLTIDVTDSGTGVMNHTLEIKKGSSTSWRRQSSLNGPLGNEFNFSYGEWDVRVLIFDYAENSVMITNSSGDFWVSVGDNSAPYVEITDLERINSSFERAHFQVSESAVESGVSTVLSRYSLDNITFIQVPVFFISKTHYYADIPLNLSEDFVFIELTACDMVGNTNHIIQQFVLPVHYIYIFDISFTEEINLGTDLTVNATIESSDPITNIVLRYYYEGESNQITEISMMGLDIGLYQLTLTIPPSKLNRGLIYIQINATNSFDNSLTEWFAITLIKSEDLNTSSTSLLSTSTTSVSSSEVSINSKSTSTPFRPFLPNLLLILFVPIVIGLSTGGILVYRRNRAEISELLGKTKDKIESMINVKED
jgi:hypothetical protein